MPTPQIQVTPSHLVTSPRASLQKYCSELQFYWLAGFGSIAASSEDNSELFTLIVVSPLSPFFPKLLSKLYPL
jgi:hypothetical protein